jgi:hypothetical protein
MPHARPDTRRASSFAGRVRGPCGQRTLARLQLGRGLVVHWRDLVNTLTTSEPHYLPSRNSRSPNPHHRAAVRLSAASLLARRIPIRDRPHREEVRPTPQPETLRRPDARRTALHPQRNPSQPLRLSVLDPVRKDPTGRRDRRRGSAPALVRAGAPRYSRR